MQNWLKRLTHSFQLESTKKKTRSTARTTARRCRPSLDCLEERAVPAATFSSIASNFNGTAIPAGSSVWFNAAFKASGLGAGPVTIHVTNQHISGLPSNVDVPDSILKFSPANTVATTNFDVGQNAWITNLPMSWSGNAFLGGATFVAANGLPGGIKPVTWSGDFTTDTAGVQVSWQWGAAVYTNFSADYNALNVKPLDSNSATLYHNSDHAGTPEAYKTFVTGGARGGGGSNWTGSYSSTRKVVPALEDVITPPAKISGTAFQVFDDPNVQPVVLAGVRITLWVYDVNGNLVNSGFKITDSVGYYEFTDVLPGTYKLTNDGNSDPSYSFAGAHAGTGDGVGEGTATLSTIDNIALASGEIGVQYDFYLIKSDVPPSA